jgi:hypothetical protein
MNRPNEIGGRHASRRTACCLAILAALVVAGGCSKNTEQSDARDEGIAPSSITPDSAFRDVFAHRVPDIEVALSSADPVDTTAAAIGHRRTRSSPARCTTHDDTYAGARSPSTTAPYLAQRRRIEPRLRTQHH